MNNNKLDNDFSMVFKHELIAQIRQAGGTFNPEIKDDGGKISQKKDLFRCMVFFRRKGND